MGDGAIRSPLPHKGASGPSPGSVAGEAAESDRALMPIPHRRRGVALAALIAASATFTAAAHARPRPPSPAKHHHIKRRHTLRTPLATASAGYAFGVSRGRCVPDPVRFTRAFTAYAPTVYPAVGSGQWVSWRFYVADQSTNRRVYTSGWSPAAWATSTSPARLAGPMNKELPGSYTSQSMGIEVNWYSYTSGWSGPYYRYPILMDVTVNLGYGPINQAMSSC